MIPAPGSTRHFADALFEASRLPRTATAQLESGDPVRVTLRREKSLQSSLRGDNCTSWNRSRAPGGPERSEEQTARPCRPKSLDSARACERCRLLPPAALGRQQVVDPGTAATGG